MGGLVSVQAFLLILGYSLSLLFTMIEYQHDNISTNPIIQNVAEKNWMDMKIGFLINMFYIHDSGDLELIQYNTTMKKYFKVYFSQINLDYNFGEANMLDNQGEGVTCVKDHIRDPSTDQFRAEEDQYFVLFEMFPGICSPLDMQFTLLNNSAGVFQKKIMLQVEKCQNDCMP